MTERGDDMLYRKNLEKSLSRELFENPTSEYRGTPFWSWNCKVTEELIADQMEVFRKMGFGGAHLHARTGLENEYMGEEFLGLVRYADEQAKEKDMLCWLYDEDRFPSGAAGGLVTENWEYRARYVLWTRERKVNMSESREAFYESVARGEKPSGYYLTAYRIKTENGYLVSYQQITGAQPQYDSEEETKRDGRLWFVYVELMAESPWYNDQTYLDTMNKKGVERFIEVTHERYYRELGEEFGKSIPAIFTDEPQMKGSMALADGESNADVTMCFTDDLPETYEKEYGVNLLEVLPELMWDLADGKTSVHRYRYHEHLTERFVSAYCDTIADWCEDHGIAMTGHYMSEPTLYSQTLRLGEAMRCYRKQQLPGVDILCGDPEYSTIKQAVSVARQNGREGVLSELYGVTHWDFDFKGHKLQGDWQAALGVTIRVPHLAFMSMEGESKRDWPASINYQSPWWQNYSYVENYFARLNTALTRGQALAPVAVIHPIESYWLHYGPVAQSGSLREHMDENFRKLINWLLFGLIDFDFISEGVLPGQETSVDGAQKKLKVGNMAYQTILVPDLKTIRSTTLDALEAFADAGGRVVFMGSVPALVGAVESDRAKKLAEKAEIIPFGQYELLTCLEEERVLEIRHENGHASSNLFYQMRQDGDETWLFVCHVNRKRNRNQNPDRMKVRIRGTYGITCYDAVTGAVFPVACEHQNGWTVVVTDLYAEDSFLWKLTEAAAGVDFASESNVATGVDSASENAASESTGSDRTDTAGSSQAAYPVPTGTLKTFYGLVAGTYGTPGKPETILQTIYEPEAVIQAEPNVLLLDAAEWSLDGSDFHEKEEILRLDNEIRTLAGYPHRRDAYIQPWRIKHAPKEHVVTLRYEIESRIDTGAMELAMERPENAAITLNGLPCSNESCGNDAWYVDRFIRKVKLPGLKKGVNELILEIGYGRKTNLENIFLLGDFGVEARGTRAVVTEAADSVYFGDVTNQRMPFYGGSLTYRMTVTLDHEQSVKVRVPHFRSPVLEVSVDGEKKGLIAYAPHVCSLGTLSAGSHVLEICACGNRFNSFGTLHNCNDEFQWYGPDSYRTRGCEWSEAWCLRPFGILSRVEILAE